MQIHNRSYKRDIVIPVKWLLGIKKDSTRKVRLVVIGCKDKKTVYPKEFSLLCPQFRYNTTLNSVCCNYDLRIAAFHVKTTFLHGIIDLENLFPGS